MRLELQEVEELAYESPDFTLLNARCTPNSFTKLESELPHSEPFTKPLTFY